MPKLKPTTIRIEDELREVVLKAFPNAESFNQALKLFIESSENKRNKVEPRTEIEMPHDKTTSPQITAFMPKERIKIGENNISPCNYASLTVRPSKLSEKGLEYLAFCDDPNKTHLPKNRLIPISACQKCYERHEEALREINKEMRGYWCEECENPSNISELPCVKNPDLECGYKKSDLYVEYPCPFIEHKEWRRLF